MRSNIGMPFHVRLWTEIERRGPTECWPWKGKSLISGYGSIGRDYKKVLVHRAVWEEVNGPIPKGDGWHGTIVMHSCDNRLCCNPRHLRLGTQSENVKDMDAKGRRVTKPQLGSKHHNSKLTEKDVLRIRADKRPIAEIAKDYGMTYQNIWYIKKRQAWKHL